jgi:hypothetical protein
VSYDTAVIEVRGSASSHQTPAITAAMLVRGACILALWQGCHSDPPPGASTRTAPAQTTPAKDGERAVEPESDYASLVEPSARVPPESGGNDLPLPRVKAEPEPSAGLRPLDAPTSLVHTVVPGETIHDVAARYDEPARWVRKWNGIPDDRVALRAGARLSIRARRRPPVREPVAVVVDSGDTWESLGREHGFDDRRLQRLARSAVGPSLDPGDRMTLWVDPSWRARRDREAAVESVIPAGAVGVGGPKHGIVVNAVQIPEGPGYERRFPHYSYGSTAAVRDVVAALTHFHAEAGYAGTIRLGSMSKRRGGPLPPHDSHQSGRDLDVKLPLRAELPPTLPRKPKFVDWQATWHLLDAFASTGTIELMYLDWNAQARVRAAALASGVPAPKIDALLQHPSPRLSSEGVVRHFEGHEDHVHVRFACPDDDVFCTD